MINKPEDFISHCGVRPQKEEVTSGDTVKVLPELFGLPWNEITMAYVLSLNPRSLRVSSDMLTADSCSGRVTVMIDNYEDKIIREIFMEVILPCRGEISGHEMRGLLREMWENNL